MFVWQITTELIHLFTRHAFSFKEPKGSICMILISLRGYNEGLSLDVKSPRKGEGDMNLKTAPRVVKT